MHVKIKIIQAMPLELSKLILINIIEKTPA